MRQKFRHLDVPWSVGDAVVFILAWLLIPIAVLVVLSWLGPHVGLSGVVQALQNNDIRANFGYVVFDALLAAALLAYFLRKYQVGWRELGFRRFKIARTVVYFLVGFFVFLLLAWVAEQLAQHFIPGFNPNQPQVNEFTQSAVSHRWLSLLALVVIPPFVEESIFRGFLFPAFAKRWNVVWGAIITSALFGIAHWQGNVTVYTLVLSLVLCFLYYKLGSLWPGIALHMLNNYLAFIVLTTK